MNARTSTTWTAAPALPTLLVLVVLLVALVGLEYRSLAHLRAARVVEQGFALARFAEFIRGAVDDDLHALCERSLDGVREEPMPLPAGEPVRATFTVVAAAGEETWSLRGELAPTLEMRAAFASWLMQEGTRVVSTAVVPAGSDPAAPLLVRPLVDAQQRVIGATGLVLDRDRFVRERLPALVEAQREPTLRLAGRDDPALRITDGRGTVLIAEHVDEGRGDVIAARRSLYLPEWRIEVRSRGDTIPDEARQCFLTHGAIVGVLALLLALLLFLILRQSAQATRLARMQSDFVANVSHELRTPLAALRLLGENLQEGRVSAAGDVRRYGGRIAAEAHRLSGRVDRLLEFSRIESGRGLRRQPLRLDELVAAAVDRFRASLPPGRAAGVRCGPAARIDVFADRDAIEQALLELLDNAVKYSPAGSEIDVWTERGDRDASIHVRDRGRGIAADDLLHLFERFHRGGSSLVHDVKGFGLGLAIVRELVVAHGGRVSVASSAASAADGGTTFTIVLPEEPA